MSIEIHTLNTDELSLEAKEVVRSLLVKSYSQYELDYKDPEIWKNYITEIQNSVEHPAIDKIIVAKEADEIVGSVYLFIGSEQAYNKPELNIKGPIFRLLAVDPEKRGKRIAQRLVEACITYTKSLDHEELVLHTSDNMASAVKLYERMGFVRAAEYEFNVGDILVKSYKLQVANYEA